MAVRLTERGRWVLVIIPGFLLAEAAFILGGLALLGPEVFQP